MEIQYGDISNIIKYVLGIDGLFINDVLFSAYGFCVASIGWVEMNVDL